MKKRTIAFLLCALLLSTAFLGVGYAALTDELTVSGQGTAKVPKIVYISAATVSSGTVTNITRSGTLLGSTVTLGASNSAQAVIHVTVKNNTDYPYVFNGITYTEGADTYDNTAIAVSASVKKGVGKNCPGLIRSSPWRMKAQSLSKPTLFGSLARSIGSTKAEPPYLPMKR